MLVRGITPRKKPGALGRMKETFFHSAVEKMRDELLQGGGGLVYDGV